MRSAVVLADSLFVQAKFDEALNLYGKAIETFRLNQNVSGEETDIWLAIALNNSGLIRQNRGNFEEAENLFYESLRHAEKLSGQDAIVKSIALSNIGFLNRDRGDLETALEFYNKALAVQEKLFNDPKYETGIIIGNIGNVLKDLGKYAEAETELAKAYEIVKTTMGEDHQFSIPPLVSLADINYFQGEYERSLEQMNRALALKKIIPEDHLDFSQTYLVLGKIHTKTGREKEGENLLRKAIEIKEKIMGAERSNTGASKM